MAWLPTNTSWFWSISSFDSFLSYTAVRPVGYIHKVQSLAGLATHPIHICMANKVFGLNLVRVIVWHNPLLQLLPGKLAIFIQVPVLTEVLSLCR